MANRTDGCDVLHLRIGNAGLARLFRLGFARGAQALIQKTVSVDGFDATLKECLLNEAAQCFVYGPAGEGPIDADTNRIARLVMEAKGIKLEDEGSGAEGPEDSS